MTANVPALLVNVLVEHADACTRWFRDGDAIGACAAQEKLFRMLKNYLYSRTDMCRVLIVAASDWRRLALLVRDCAFCGNWADLPHDDA